MTNGINEARERIEEWGLMYDENRGPWGDRLSVSYEQAALNLSDIRTVLDALDAAERERDEALAVIERAKANLSNAPECDEHPDGDPITCGWKSDMIHVRRALSAVPEN